MYQHYHYHILSTCISSVSSLILLKTGVRGPWRAVVRCHGKRMCPWKRLRPWIRLIAGKILHKSSFELAEELCAGDKRVHLLFAVSRNQWGMCSRKEDLFLETRWLLCYVLRPLKGRMCSWKRWVFSASTLERSGALERRCVPIMQCAAFQCRMGFQRGGYTLCICYQMLDRRSLKVSFCLCACLSVGHANLRGSFLFAGKVSFCLCACTSVGHANLRGFFLFAGKVSFCLCACISVGHVNAYGVFSLCWGMYSMVVWRCGCLILGPLWYW